jgi:outer membrane lipoprotein carrier protein
MLLAGGASMRAGFAVRALGLRDGFNWVNVAPRDAGSDFKEAQFGFRAGQLARMLIIDKLGQRSVLSFSAVTRNKPIDPALVSFILPKGVDLIGKPVAP